MITVKSTSCGLSVARIATGFAILGLLPMAAGDSRSFRGEPVVIPPMGTVRIEAEDYDLGGEGVAYHEKTTYNWGKCYRADEPVDLKRVLNEPGKFALTETDPGEWINYSIKVVRDGQYHLRMRTSRPPDEQPGRTRISFNGVDEQIIVQGRGGYNRFEVATYGPFNLSAGEQVLRIEFIDKWTAIDWMELEAVGASEATDSTTAPATMIKEAAVGK